MRRLQDQAPTADLANGLQASSASRAFYGADRSASSTAGPRQRCRRVDVARRSEVVVEQVYVRRGREGRRVASKPALRLNSWPPWLTLVPQSAPDAPWSCQSSVRRAGGRACRSVGCARVGGRGGAGRGPGRGRGRRRQDAAGRGGYRARSRGRHAGVDRKLHRARRGGPAAQSAGRCAAHADARDGSRRARRVPRSGPAGACSPASRARPPSREHARVGRRVWQRTPARTRLRRVAYSPTASTVGR